ncbi:FAD-dependent oxidoreductase [Actinomadura sp. NPDC023710]|uniref:flavin monoamine oxidase family protein n=1 Tax=Actinomadura sp. NPDC023710 TaxID=3158219 RepID=UPI0033CC5518
MGFDCDIAVVGAGLAGLMAADRLRQADIDVIVLEGRNRPGGRAYTRRNEGRIPLDLGAQFIGSSQIRLHSLANAAGLETVPVYREGHERILLAGQEVSGQTEPMHAQLRSLLADLDRIALALDPVEPWRSSQAAQFDAQTLRQWLDSQACPAADRVAALTEAYLAAAASEVSMLHALNFMRANGGFAATLLDRPAETQVLGGVHGLVDHLAAGYGDRLRYGNIVQAVDQNAEGVILHSRSGSVRARRAIISLPLPLSGRIQYDPPLSVARDSLAQRASLGSSIKFHAIYEEPFWREDGWSGRTADPAGAVLATVDSTVTPEHGGILTGFLAAKASARQNTDDLTEIRGAIGAHLTACFGRRASRYVELVTHYWATEPLNRGDVTNFAPGALSTFGHDLRVPHGRVHWAGSDLSPLYPDHMEGALCSGEDTANEVIAEF